MSLLILRLGFFSERQHSLSQLNPDRDKIFEFSVSKNFQGASGATTSAANGFKFGATANMYAPQESSPVLYSDDAAYQQYLRRVLDTTLNQGLINHHNINNGLTSESSKTKKDPKVLLLTSGYSDEAAFQQYLQRVLATTSNKGLHMQGDMGRSSQPPAVLLPLCPQGKQDSG